MPTEVTILAWAGVVLVAQFVLMAISVNNQLGTAYSGGPRDERREPTGIPGRLHRALHNMFEAVAFFTLAVVVVTLGDAATPATALAAKVFLCARIAYVPAYVSGIPMLRSMIWITGFLATAFMVVQALL